MFFATPARADGTLGVAFFQMPAAGFQCERALSVYRGVRRRLLATLWGTFGDDWSCLTSFLTTCQLNHYECTVLMHFSNESCRRFGRCGKGELLSYMSVSEINAALSEKNPIALETIRARAETIAAFFEPYLGDVQVLLTEGLEDNYTPNAHAVMARQLRKTWPGKLIRNPVGANVKTYSGADFLELHGVRGFTESASRAAHFWSNDGEDVYLGARRWMGRDQVSISSLRDSIRRHIGGGGDFLLWWANQGTAEHNGHFVYPRRRKPRLYRADILTANKLLRDFHAR